MSAPQQQNAKPANKTAIANPAAGLREMLEKSKNQIATALPKHLTAERMIRVAITAYQRTPALQECSPLSVVGCVVQAAELGLELSGPLGQAYMVPYWNKNTKQKEAQFQVGYRGLMDLAYRSGKVTTFNAHCVYANDFFRFRYGTKPELTHEPTIDDPGEVIAVYAVLNMAGGAFDFEVMSKVQIDMHRTKYSKQKGTDYSPWETAWEEMAKKTVIRKLAKRAPVSVEVRAAASADEYAEAEVSNVREMNDMAPPIGRQLLRGQAQPAIAAANGDGGHKEESQDQAATPPPTVQTTPTTEAPNGEAAQTTEREAGFELQDELTPDDRYHHFKDALSSVPSEPEREAIHTNILSARAANLITEEHKITLTSISHEIRKKFAAKAAAAPGKKKFSAADMG